MLGLRGRQGLIGGFRSLFVERAVKDIQGVTGTQRYIELPQPTFCRLPKTLQ